jgi:hypothetical protein
VVAMKLCEYANNLIDMGILFYSMDKNRKIVLHHMFENYGMLDFYRIHDHNFYLAISQITIPGVYRGKIFFMFLQNFDFFNEKKLYIEIQTKDNITKDYKIKNRIQINW